MDINRLLFLEFCSCCKIGLFGLTSRPVTLAFKVHGDFVLSDDKFRVICEGQSDVLISHKCFHRCICVRVWPDMQNFTFTGVYSWKFLISQLETRKLEIICLRIMTETKSSIPVLWKKKKKKIKPDCAVYEEKWSSLTMKSLRTIPTVLFSQELNPGCFSSAPLETQQFVVFGVQVSLSMQNSLIFHLHRAALQLNNPCLQEKSNKKRCLHAHSGGKSCLEM